MSSSVLAVANGTMWSDMAWLPVPFLYICLLRFVLDRVTKSEILHPNISSDRFGLVYSLCLKDLQISNLVLPLWP